MEFDDLRAFVSIAETGSVSGAAHELHVTQSAVTRRLQRLETSLGVTLLDRKTRPAALTRAGEATLERCRRVINDLREIRLTVSNGSVPAAEVRLGVAHAMVGLTLVGPLGEVRRNLPRTAIRIRTGWSHELLERVRTGAYDVAVILLPGDERLPAGVTGQGLAEEKLVVVAPRGRRLVRSIEDLSGEQWILNPEGCGARAALRKALLRANVDMVVGIETYNYELQLALVADGRGLGLVPRRAFERSRVRRRIRTLAISGLDCPAKKVWVIHHNGFAASERFVAELSRALIETLRR